jgi:hypothetical protein
MGWTAADMARWIGNNLGPTLAASKPGLDVKIITLDDNKGAISTWAKEVRNNKSSSSAGSHFKISMMILLEESNSMLGRASLSLASPSQIVFL